nr:AOS3 [Salvia miltiorrhiza]
MSSVDELPLKEIPGGYGLPFFGPISDRLDFHYRQGPDEFFRARMQQHNSTVFRANAPPGPFTARNPKVVVLLDAASFQILFDTSKVEKRDVFTGTFMPSTSFTGGYRVCSYLDPSEPKHALLKGFFLSVLGRLHKELIPTFRAAATQLFADVEAELAEKGESEFNPISDRMSFDLLFRLLPARARLKFLPNFVEDLLLHTFPLPYFPAKSGYELVHSAFREAAGELLDEAEEKGLSRDEASHNMMFVMGFNSYGGTKILFPALLKYVAGGGEDLHRRLASEIRRVVEEEGGVTLAALERMSLVKSVVWETMRIEPPVQFQYGKAKEDLKISSHVATYVVKKGETIFGYQPFATRDPVIFVNPDEFVPDRFLDGGEKLLKYVYWSNGRETDSPTADNKQCPAKDMVVVLGRMMLVELFMRYETFSVEFGKLLLGSSVTIKSLTNPK